LLASLPTGVEVIIVPDADKSLSEKRSLGAYKARGKYLLFIDDDNYVDRDAIEFLMAFRDKEIGVMGMMACYHDKPDTVADGGSVRNYLTSFMKGINTNKKTSEIPPCPYEVNEVANAFMVKKELFFRVGGFDAERFPIDLDEADLCKRIKNLGYKIMVCPAAVCYHKSNTYSCIPDFRRPKNAYFMGRNRIFYQRKHLSPTEYFVFMLVFFPIFVSAYCACLICRGKLGMVVHFLKGVQDGISGRRQNTY
jgi:GT2 family glycosyltransferase